MSLYLDLIKVLAGISLGVGLIIVCAWRLQIHSNRMRSKNYIKLFDDKGNEYFISRKEYQQNILPGKFEDLKNNPDQLYSFIGLSLDDGFFNECIRPAQQLLKIDSNRERATVVLTIAYMKSGYLDKARKIINHYLKEIGTSGTILTNLAKVYALGGNDLKAERILWEALRTDPNQYNALVWWMAIHYERGGKDERYRSLSKVAELPGSWWAKLYLAREALERGDTKAAIDFYNSIIPFIQDSGDALLTISGDLGKKGLYQIAYDIVHPIYDPVRHGPYAGFNLIQSCIRQKKYEQARLILNGIKQLKRIDLVKYIDSLEKKLK